MYGEWSDQDESEWRNQHERASVGQRIANQAKESQRAAEKSAAEAKQQLEEQLEDARRDADDLRTSLHSIQDLRRRSHKMDVDEFHTELAGIMNCVTCMPAYQRPAPGSLARIQGEAG